MLGPELETFKGNKVVMGLMIVLALGVYALGDFIATRPYSDITVGGKIFMLSFVIWPIFLFFWVKSVRVTLHSDGISYRTLFGEKEIRWDALERFEYGAVKQSVNFVPVGTYYHVKLVDADGKKIRFGNQVDSPGKVASKVIELSYPELYRKVVERFNNDQELDFGAIRVSRSGGVKVKKFFGGYREIPWAQVSSCDIRQGHFYIWSVGEKSTRGPRLRQVPNAFVLLGLMNAVLKSNA
jgi:hypothetical protein